MNVDVILPNTRTAGECFLLTRITYLKNVINWTPAFAGVTVASRGRTAYDLIHSRRIGHQQMGQIRALSCR